MKKITLICVGNLKEDFWKNASKEYVKRLSKFCDLEMVEIAEEKLSSSPTPAETEKVLEKEAQKILEKTNGKKTFCFCIEGKQVSSPEFSSLLEKSTNDGPVAFVVGSSFGLSKLLKSKFEQLSFGKITLPHQLFRIVLLEQIYRAFTIIAGATYHK